MSDLPKPAASTCVFSPPPTLTCTTRVEAGRFRDDLLFRLNTVEIHLPPLRERREDIPPLAAHFLARYAQRYRKQVSGFDPGAVQAMLLHSMARQRARARSHHGARRAHGARHQLETADLGLNPPRSSSPRLDEMSLEAVESILIRKALARSTGNVSQAADALGLSRGALYRRMEKYGIQATQPN